MSKKDKMSDQIEIPLDLHCLYTIVVKNGKQSKIIELLQLSKTQAVEWDVALKTTRDNSNEYENYENVIVTKEINGWIFIVCEQFYTQTYAMNCYDRLSKEFGEIYYFLVDAHSGIYRFTKIIEGQIVRFFERDCNHNTGEFGALIQEEKELEKESKEHSYFHVGEVADKVLEFNKKLVGTSLFDDDVIIGRRYLKEVEKYKEYIFILEKYKPTTQTETKNLEDDDLPF